MKYAISFVLCLSLSGCIGPQFLKVQRYKYNEAIQESTAEQLLLNIVRLRYNDSPMFLNVGDIDAKFTLESSAEASATIMENVGAAPLNANSATATASSGFTNNPNIKLSPMQDADFARLLEPLTASEMLALVTKRQSRYEYLALAMQSYTYTPKPKEGDTNEPEDGDEEETKDKEITVDAYRHSGKWIEFLTSIKKNDKDGTLRIESKMAETEELLPGFGADAIAPEDVIKAKLAGLTFKEKKHEDEKYEDEKHEDEYVLVGARLKWTLSLAEIEYKKKDPSGRELDQLPVRVQEIRVEFMQGNESVSRGEDKEPIEDKEEPIKKIRSRSLVQMMYCLSLGVEVPSPHENERSGPPAKDRILGFHVEFGALPPFEAFVSVKYRGYWFYIKRSDRESKKFFSVLTELFVERAGKAATTPTILPL